MSTNEAVRPPSQVENVLEDAKRDLKNTDLMLMNPIRDRILQPALGVIEAVLPKVTNIIPFADAVVACGLSLPFNVMRAGYGLVHGNADGVNHEEWRHFVSDSRLVAFLAEEIKRNCDQASTEDLSQQFMKEQDGSFTFKNINIVVPDGTTLYATVLEPVKTGGKLPAVIFVNSWTCTEHEYIVLASRLAKKGYVVLSYCTRGFGKSGGLVNVAGPKDREDMGAVLDWLEDNTHADMTNVGISGLSYGAGLSLIGAATQDRIKTAAALAGWADLAGSLYGNQSPRAVWGFFLLASGYTMGNMDPVIKDKLAGILMHENVEDAIEWADERSVMSYFNKINAENKPIYMANSFGDDLFNPNQNFKFFERLKVPKRMDFSQGIHATPEMFGLLGAPNYVWENVFKWFDYHLKGQVNNIMDVQVSMELKLESYRQNFSRWPSRQTTTKRFYLKPRGFFSDGTLSTTESSSDDSSTTITSVGLSSSAVSGIPLLSPFFEAHFHQAIPALLGINRFRSIVYYSEALESTLKIRGQVNLSLVISASISKAQIVAYLYDNIGGGVAKLITHGVITEHELTPNHESRLNIEIQAAAYDVPQGHHLAISIDTRDPLYAPPVRNLYSLTVFHSSDHPSVLELQCVQ